MCAKLQNLLLFITKQTLYTSSAFILVTFYQFFNIMDHSWLCIRRQIGRKIWMISILPAYVKKPILDHSFLSIRISHGNGPMCLHQNHIRREYSLAFVCAVLCSISPPLFQCLSTLFPLPMNLTWFLWLADSTIYSKCSMRKAENQVLWNPSTKGRYIFVRGYNNCCG